MGTRATLMGACSTGAGEHCFDHDGWVDVARPDANTLTPAGEL
jgi:hypothetical protein